MDCVTQPGLALPWDITRLTLRGSEGWNLEPQRRHYRNMRETPQPSAFSGCEVRVLKDDPQRTNSGGKGSTWPRCRPRAFISETRRIPKVLHCHDIAMTSWHGWHGPIAHMAMPAPYHCSIGTGRSSGGRGSDFPMTCASFGLPASRLESARVKG